MTVAIAAGLLDGRPTGGPARTVALLAGAAMLAAVVARRRAGVPWTWLALGTGTLVTSLVTTGARYEDAVWAGPAISALGYLISFVGVWMLREQRVQGGQVTFFLDALGSLVAVGTLACLLSLFGRGAFRDGSELMYTLGLTTSIMLAATMPIIASVGRTPFCARDRWLTAAYTAGMVGTLLMTLSLRRDLPLTDAGLALTALQLPMMAIAATRRPGIAGPRHLGIWWEWVPPASWAAVGAATLLAATAREIPGELITAAVVALAFSVVRFAHTVREVGTVVLERHRSLTDELTGLPNRHTLFHELELLTHTRGASGEEATLLVLGVDNFRSLRDTLGHQAGDLLLTAIAHRLADAAGSDGQVMRMSDEEFAVIVRPPADPAVLGDRLLRSFAAVFDVESVNVALNASIGLARFPSDASDVHELARRAQVAMSDAKRRRVGVASYRDELDASSVAQLALADDLRRALDDEDGGLWVGFQPQLDLASREIHGAEALLRWRHPAQGEIPPDQLLPIAERNGLLTPLTDWVLERTVRAAAALREQHGDSLRFAVNVSAATLVDVRLPERIQQTLDRHGVYPRQLVVEVTEDALMSDQGRCLEVVERIARLGVEIAIDDFGTGHSTLAQLRTLPAHELKIDRGFVQAMTSDLLDAEIVRLIVRMGRQVHLRVVAEGVETTQERRMLADFGCSVVQGYGIARPMPLAELSAFLAGHEGAASMRRAA